MTAKHRPPARVHAPRTKMDKPLSGNRVQTRKKKEDAAISEQIRSLSDELPPVPTHTHRPKDMVAAKIKACEGMRRFGTIVYASRFSQIGRSAVYEEMKADPVFHAGLRRAKAEWLDELETAMGLRGMLPRGDLAGIFILKHNRSRYKEIQRVELSGSGGGPVQYMDVKTELLRRLTKLTPKDNVPLVVNGVEVRELAARSAGSGGSAGSAGSRGPGSRGLAVVRDDAPDIRRAEPDDATAPRRRRPRT